MNRRFALVAVSLGVFAFDNASSASGRRRPRASA